MGVLARNLLTSMLLSDNKQKVIFLPFTFGDAKIIIMPVLTCGEKYIK